MNLPPRGITQSNGTGPYRVRVKRGPVWHLAGSHATVPEAQDALAALLLRIGPQSPTRTPRVADWPREAKQQLREHCGGVRPRNVACGKSGWTVQLTRKGRRNIYARHFTDILSAIAARDAAELKYPVTTTRKTHQP